MRTPGKLMALILLALGLTGCSSATIPTAAPTPTSTPTPTAMVQISVYFTDSQRLTSGTAPLEVAVTRTVPATATLPEAALTEFFKGPTAEEQARGLQAITSGFTGLSSLEIEDGIARVHLAGPCASNGAAYTVAQLLIKNLLQFPEIKAVKIYDASGQTSEPTGESNSIPICLEP